MKKTRNAHGKPRADAVAVQYYGHDSPVPTPDTRPYSVVREMDFIPLETILLEISMRCASGRSEGFRQVRGAFSGILCLETNQLETSIGYAFGALKRFQARFRHCSR